MDTLPSIELLEATHDFPGWYMFKVIGRADDGFVARVVDAVRDELEVSVDPPFRCQPTASGRHVSITIEPFLDNVFQVLAVYRRLKGTPGLVMFF